MSNEELITFFISKFKRLFRSCRLSILTNLEGLFKHMVTKLENLELMKMLKEEELKHAFWNIHPLKALEPNGFFGIFNPNH